MSNALIEALANFTKELEKRDLRSTLLIPLTQRDTGIQLDLAIGLSGFEQEIVEERIPP